ncbi:hypothetical protein ACFSCW_15535 [Sphingomonas tabacisoli]|uniref:Uncharacterized protein n=1 Tax=Sphingomonas tabacisoli TaxID=2249466 RepID=A0ABW4I7K0_9SPHN
MKAATHSRVTTSAGLALLLLLSAPTGAKASAGLTALPATGSVDPRFLSYNIEMLEVTGGRFWRPYGSPGADRYEYRPPLNLGDRRLRAAAKALAPAYVRYSGTWANATWFADTATAPEKPPAGFDSVLTQQQWRGAIDFANATGAAIVTSFPTSPGTRDAKGVWQSDTAARWLAFTRRAGGRIAAAEFANEPNMVTLTRPPEGYTGADYRRDYASFATWLRRASPGTLLLAPGFAELGEPTRTMSKRNKSMQQFEGEELLTAELPRPDGFSFHFYGGASERCGGKIMGHSLEKALSPAWLDQLDPALARMKALRDRVAPGVPLWNTESAETACGGNPWASSFADSFRFVDTLGRSAQAGVRVFMHNTLAASDYGLLEEHDFTPRPNFWAALLWKRTMGTTVLVPPPSPAPELRIYAHCLPNRGGGVGLAVINLGDEARSLPVGGNARTWIFRAAKLDSKAITISGRTPALSTAGVISGLEGETVAGELMVPGRSIAFLAATSAGNKACRGSAGQRR